MQDHPHSNRGRKARWNSSLLCYPSLLNCMGPARLPGGEVKVSQTHKVIRTSDGHPKGELFGDLQPTNKLEGD
ncbi:Protein Fam90A26-Like [Manis pentadactyla]|nr:Protein Fam90A26-Like [Manis pentadactyla]